MTRNKWKLQYQLFSISEDFVFTKDLAQINTIILLPIATEFFQVFSLCHASGQVTLQGSSIMSALICWPRYFSQCLVSSIIYIYVKNRGKGAIVSIFF